MKIDEKSLVFPEVEEALFERKEGFWRINLPKDYKDFIKKFNGVRPIGMTFIANNHEYVVDRFLCILRYPNDFNLGEYDIDVTLTMIEERLSADEELIGADMLPIAVLFAGDFLCLDFRKDKENPSVCVWDHELSGDFDPMIYYVADNFTEFMKNCKYE